MKQSNAAKTNRNLAQIKNHTTAQLSFSLVKFFKCSDFFYLHKKNTWFKVLPKFCQLNQENKMHGVSKGLHGKANFEKVIFIFWVVIVIPANCFVSRIYFRGPLTMRQFTFVMASDCRLISPSRFLPSSVLLPRSFWVPFYSAKTKPRGVANRWICDRIGRGSALAWCPRILYFLNDPC